MRALLVRQQKSAVEAVTCGGNHHRHRRSRIRAAVYSKVVILLRQSRFDALKEALSSSVCDGPDRVQVLGLRRAEGTERILPGVPNGRDTAAKVKVEVVVSRVSRCAASSTSRSGLLYTGHIGDGKIFVYNVENVVKVRTGEEGVAALQDTH